MVVWCDPVSAAPAHSKVTVGEPDSWVVKRETPAANPELGKDQGLVYRIVDYQTRIHPELNDQYRHFAIALKTSDAVEENANFSIAFDPTYQTVKIHHLNLIRDGQVLDRLNFDEFEFFRQEKDRDKLIFNGSFEASYIIPDVRIGDVLDYSFTRSGVNPAIGPHFQYTIKQEYSTPIGLLSERLLVSKDLPVFSKLYNSPETVNETEREGYREFTWSRSNLDNLEFEQDRPDWHYVTKTIVYSSFENWADVGEFFSDRYQPENIRHPEIEKITNDIMGNYDSPADRTRAALDYVHKNIRYTGVEIGVGGYTPREPATVLNTRFGDCKDMTKLLLALLTRMEIDAVPVLVDSDFRGGIDEFQPGYGFFDHILIRARIDNQFFLLDGTRGEQMGDLAHLFQARYGKGLIVTSDSPGLVDLPATKIEYFEDVVDTYDVVSDPDSVTFQTRTSYFGFQADNMKSQLRNKGLKSVEKNFMDFYSKVYSDIEQIGDMEFEEDADKGRLTFIASYKVGWELIEDENKKELSAYPIDVSDDIPDAKFMNRKTPFQIGHPLRSRHELVFKMDDDWSLKNEDITKDLPAFKFTKKATFEDYVYKAVFSYESKADHIKPDDFEESMQALKKIDDLTGVNLQYSLNSSDESEWGGKIGSAIGVLYLLGILIAVFAAVNTNMKRSRVSGTNANSAESHISEF